MGDVMSAARSLRQLASRSADAQRALETGITEADGAWMDPARGRFETRHLAEIRGDARALRSDLEEIARLAQEAEKAIARR